MKFDARVRRLTEAEKTDEMFAQLLRITNESFQGIQRPSELLLHSQFVREDVYVATAIQPDIIGYAIVTKKHGQPYIWSIAVSAKFRGMSVGSQLLRKVIANSGGRGNEFVGLTCKYNNPAQKLYFDEGFRVVKILEGFYAQEGDGLLMRRNYD